jgi:hypothetical protein
MATLSVTSPAGISGGTYAITVNTSDVAQAIHAASAALSDTVTAPDTIPPTEPPSISGTVSVSKKGHALTYSVKLAWGASTDNVGVVRYNVSRDGVAIGTPTTTSFADKPGAGTFTYAVSAVDAAGNVSAANSVVVVVP